MLVTINTKLPLPLMTSETESPIIVVCSHERSGTHHMMNTLSLNSDYCADPFINFDLNPISAYVNFFHPQGVEGFFQKLIGIEHKSSRLFVRSIVKSHHDADCFRLLMGSKNVYFVYMLRDPLSVMESFWKFIHRWEWSEGPKTSSLAEFVLAPPRGQLMRYQSDTYPSMIDRWCAHADKWLLAAEEFNNVIPVEQEALSLNPEPTISKIAKITGISVNEEIAEASKESYITGADLQTEVHDREVAREIIFNRVRKTNCLSETFKNRFSNLY